FTPRNMLASAAFASLAALTAVFPGYAQTAGPGKPTMTQDQARKAVAPFYDMLNQPATKDLKMLGESAIAPHWRSYAGEGNSKGREEFIAQVGGFGKLIPDLAWDIKEVLVDGNRVIVRSEASGTPAGPFFGVPHGGKSFRIMTIDIHTVQDGKLVEAHHVEDWAGAMRQLSAK
ncbi:MAG: ester cyclase, partial [Terriglobales bacterium]